jgi:hypothetical protein
MGLLDNFSQPFRISSLLPSEAQLQAFKQKSDAEALAQFSQDPNPIRRVPFNILTALGVNPTIAQAAPTTLDVAPLTGDISALADARTAFGQGDLATAGLLTAATLIPGVPAGKVKSLLSKEKKTTPLLFNDLPEQVDPTKTGFIFKGIARPNLSKSENRFFNNGFGQKEAVLPIRSMNAAQDKVNPDFTITESSSGELPLVIKKDNELFVSDGHHRLTKLAVQGEQNAKVRLVDFDEPTTTPLLDYDPRGSATDKAILEELGIESPNEGLLKKSDDTKPLLNVDNAPKEGIANVVPPTDTDSGIIAFHGSGADFDQFKLSKIGTGEGAQAFGYGLYFTDSEDIAKFYKNAMSRNVDIDGKPYIRGNKINDELVDPDIADDLGATNGDLEAAIKSSEDFLQEMIAADNVTAIRSTSKELEKLKQLRGRISINEKAGKTYKVALAPKPEELLDYDLPLSEQSDLVKGKVINVLKDIYPNVKNPALTMKGSDLIKQVETALSAKNFDEVERINRLIKEQNAIMIANASPVGYRKFINKKGEDAAKEYDRLLDERAKLPTGGFDKAASELLSKQGIKGIKYKAGQLSRRVPGVKDTDATNFVIFDENLINILAKYGIVGSVGITALQNSDI